MVPVKGNTRWQNLFNHLKDKGFDVYSPGTKIGECKAAYVVISHDGSSRHPTVSSDEDLYAVMCYVPKLQYSTLEEMVQEIKAAMVELKPMFLPYGSQTPSFYDDSVKAHMVSIEYKNYKKIM